MSTITGSCTENAATVLFEQGLQKTQEQKITDQQQRNSLDTNQVPVSESHLGNKINIYV